MKGAKYTRSHPPVGYAAAWLLPDRASASRVEAALKRMSHREKEAAAREGLTGLEAVPTEMLRMEEHT